MTWELKEEKNSIIVTMNSNPMNLINDNFFHDLESTFNLLESQYSDKAVILTGNERIFSAGLDFKFCHQMFLQGDQKKIQNWFEHFSHAILKVFHFSQPLVAAINGHCIAGGLILALCAEFRIASEGKSQFALNEIQIGIPMPSTFIEIINYAIGQQETQESILSARNYSLDKAKEMNMIHEIVKAEELIERALEKVQHITPERIPAYCLTKKNLRLAVEKRLEHFAIENDYQMPAALSSSESIKVQREALEKLSKK